MGERGRRSGLDVSILEKVEFGFCLMWLVGGRSLDMTEEHAFGSSSKVPIYVLPNNLSVIASLLHRRLTASADRRCQEGFPYVCGYKIGRQKGLQLDFGIHHTHVAHLYRLTTPFIEIRRS